MVILEFCDSILSIFDFILGFFLQLFAFDVVIFNDNQFFVSTF